MGGTQFRGYEPRTNQYPLYEADQFLTSTNLNDTTDYLEREIRATRSYLVGNGILKGLDQFKVTYGISPGAITSIQMTAGYGLTPDGYLLETPGYYPNRISPGPVIFTKAVNLKLHLFVSQNPNDVNDRHRMLVDHDTEPDEFINPATDAVWDNNHEDIPIDCVELFTSIADPNFDAQNMTASSIDHALSITPPPSVPVGSPPAPPVDLTNTVLVFMAAGWAGSKANCGVGSCDDQGKNRLILGRFFLVPIAALEGTANVVFETHPLIQIPRLANMQTVNVIEDHYKNINDVFTKSQSIIGDALNKIQFHYPKILPTNDIHDAMVKFTTQFNIANYPPASTAHYADFARDMHAAITEYTKKYNELTLKYPDLNEGRICRVMVLGNVLNTNSVDPFRYYFSPSINTCNGQCDILNLKKMCARFISMINSFIFDPKVLVSHMVQVQAGAPTTIKVIPSKEQNVLLGDRCIPHYYDVSKNLNPMYSVVARTPSAVQYFPPDFKAYPAGYTGNNGVANVLNVTAQNIPLPVQQVTIDTKQVNADAVPTESCNGIPTQFTGAYDLLQNWCAHSLDFHIEQVNNYYIQPPTDVAPKDLSNHENNFVKVEGHAGLPIAAVDAHMATHVNNHDLPIEVIHATPVTNYNSAYTVGGVAPPLNKTMVPLSSVTTYNLDHLKPYIKGATPTGGVPVGGTLILVNDGATVVHHISLPMRLPASVLL